MGNPDIDDLYQEIHKKILKDGSLMSFSLQLALSKTNAERVKLVYEAMTKYKMFPKRYNISKTAELSEKFRCMGNDNYKKNQVGEALKMYNKAIVHAPIGSEQLGLAYSNRSAANFSLRNFNECVIDISRALSHDCNEKLKEKLTNRKLLCDKQLENPFIDDIENQCKRQFKLSKSQHKSLLAASDSVQLSYSKEMGRSVLAALNILPGEVLAIEEPYCCLVLEPFYTEYCYGCLEPCDSMIPCDNCCHVMFCNEECKKRAFEMYHKIDCKLMPVLSAMKFTKIELLALRTVIQAKCTHDDCDSLRRLISEAESEKDPLLKGFTTNPAFDRKVFDSHKYQATHMLESNLEKRDTSDIFQKAVTASVFLHILLIYTDFFSECHLEGVKSGAIFENDCISLYGGLLLHHSMTSPSNMHSISTVSASHVSGYTESARFGGGAFPFLSLLNHSCAPNVVRFNIGSKMALIALRPILKGDQLFDNYGYHHATDSLAERQKSLKFQYKFQCQCEACANNWPMYLNLPNAKISDIQVQQVVSHSLLTQELLDDLTNGNRCVALNIINQLYPYVIILEKYAPNRELADYQETIKQCWSLFGNVSPLR